MGGHKKHKKKHKKRRKSSSSESSNEEHEWVEKECTDKQNKDEPSASEVKQRDDWLGNADLLFATIPKEQLRTGRNEKKKPDKVSIDEMGQTSKELNPYWKDGGSGLPQDCTSNTDKLSGTVGDMGLSWLHKALDRAKQTAAQENKSVEEVVAPVWGSLDRLLTLIKQAEDKSNVRSRSGDSSRSVGSNRHRSSRSFRRPDDDEDYSYRDESRSNYKSDRDRDRSMQSYKKVSDSHGRSRYDESKSSRVAIDAGRTGRLNSREESYYSGERRSWKKPSSESTTSSNKDKLVKSCPPSVSSPSPPKDDERKRSESPKEHIVDEKPEIITHDEMNQIAAEILKAEMFGNEDEVQALKEKLKKAQAWLSGNKVRNRDQKEVLLTQTDHRGFTRPVSLPSSSQPQSKKRSKLETHKDGKRVRYFATDDKYSLQDLMHQEKFVSVSDQNEMYARLAKGVGQKPEDDDFEEGGGREKTEEWADFNKMQKAAAESTKREKTLESCRFCFDSQTANRRLIISLMDKVYLSVPPYQSLTDGHCLIMPIQHTPCATLLDEDVWEEIMDLRRILVKMFLEEDKDIIFYESAKNLNKFPHMILNCVPVPKEVGDDAPIYFKKALLECEAEWSNNKKIVDLKGRNVRKAVPKGLSYFAVDFGLQSGYAHVIEDERLFPRNFAEEVIGGMMDLDHSIWRKHKKDDQQVQIEKTQQFIKRFKEFTSKTTI